MDYNFSVSMCVYGKDNPKWFKESVDSIWNQSVKPTEVVLVVDGPVPEELNALISEYEKLEDFHVIRLEKNQGHGNARRIGLENCKYELVALMDADDISVYDRFEKQLDMFQRHENVSVVGGNIVEFIGDETNIAGYRKVPQKEEEIAQYLKKRCPLNQMTVMMKKTDVQKAGGYLDWYCNEDYYLWIRMHLHNMRFVNLDEVLVKVRVGEEMYKRRGGFPYFKSEWKLQNYMLKYHVINVPIYIENVLKRVVVQLLLPNKVRGWVFKKFARQSME